MFKYGIEHEVAFINQQGKFIDFSNTPFSEFQETIDNLPYHESDYPQLRVGDAGIKLKRWYIEGYERFSEQAEVIDCPPKGIEIRTTLNDSIKSVVDELTESMQLLKKEAVKKGFYPVITSFNPFKKEFTPNPPLNQYETKRRNNSPEKLTAHIPMLTYGPDLSISLATLSTEEIIGIGKKLTFYSPFIIPFSYSSPFLNGKKWEGFSYRTFARTIKRPAVMVFLENEKDLIKSHPSLTKIARIPAEVGRIEFKAFDSCSDFSLYASLLALLKGLILDKSLSGKALVPNGEFHRLSALKGFENEYIFQQAFEVVNAAENALINDPDKHLLSQLRERLTNRQCEARQMKEKINGSTNLSSVLKLFVY